MISRRRDERERGLPAEARAATEPTCATGPCGVPGSPRDGHSIAAGIEREEALLADLDRRRGEATARLAVLRNDLAEATQRPAGSAAPALRRAPAPATRADKLKLFRTLFRGRDDVFPKLWVNPRKGTKGYA